MEDETAVACNLKACRNIAILLILGVAMLPQRKSLLLKVFGIPIKSRFNTKLLSPQPLNYIQTKMVLNAERNLGANVTNLGD